MFSLAELVEYGEGLSGEYQYEPGKETFGDFRKPTYFTQRTIDAIVTSNMHVDIMEKSLKEQGVKVK